MMDFAAYNASPQGRVALSFARALVDKQYGKAWQMLTRTLRDELSVDSLRSNYQEMVDYGQGLARMIDVTYIMDNWPGRQDRDIGWAYVSIAGDDFSEAVTVIVCEEDGEARIRSLEWGRP